MIEWDVLLRRHGRMVWRTAYRLLGHAQDAQDCMQETFLAALRLSRQQQVKNWPGLLRHLATARALDCLRSRMRERRSSATGADVDSLPGPGGNPHQKAQADELVKRLRAALTELPPRQAEVFVLRFVEGMSYRDIGRALGLKKNAVGVLLHEARGRLRESLSEGDAR